MNNDIDFNSWDVEKLDNKGIKRLSETITKKHKKRVRQRRNVRIISAALLFFVAAGSVFYLHQRSFSSQVAKLNQMLKKEAERIEIPHFLVELEEERSDEIDMEGLYD